MTAEIIIMNKEAIALASDSAVTMVGKDSKKIFTSANKLFTLSKYHPVGIMVYGSAIFMEVPWETIIKVYRNKLGKKKFNTLKEHAKNFINFLDHHNPLFPNSVQEKYLRSSILGYFSFIKNKILDKIHSNIDEKGKITEVEIKKIISKIIKEHYDNWEKTSNIPSIPKTFNKMIMNKYKDIIERSIKEVFEKLPLSRINLYLLKKIAASLFSKFPDEYRKEDISGIVIAGFGEKDIFPSLESFHIEGIVNNKLKYEKYIGGKIDFKTSASIIPFAQREMVDTFMQGIEPSYRDFVENYLNEIVREYTDKIVTNLRRYTEEEKRKFKDKLITVIDKIIINLNNLLKIYREERYINPVLNVVSMLPKDELAAMAESLVNLTSFKRKVTMEAETVAGPIDVAVISKGDGFIWIKRKHYFKAELNPQFFAIYYKEM